MADLEGSGLSGGAEIQLVTLGRAFQQKGYDVEFIVNESSPPGYQCIDGIGVHKVPFKHMGMSNAYLLIDILRFFKSLVVINADIYLMKLPRHMLFPLGLYAALFRKKVVFIGQVDGDASKSKLKSTDNKIASSMYRLGLLFTDAIVAQTNFQKVGFTTRFKGQIQVIGNILTLSRTETFTKNGSILWVGNSGKHKQPELFLELAARLPEYKFKMIMSPCSQRSDDSFIREKLYQVPNLEYLGAVPFSQMASHFQMATLFVSTSESEGFPNVFLQAWQCRTPVASLNIDPDNVIQRFGLGRLSGSFERLVENVSELMSSDDIRTEMADNAQDYTLAHHSSEVVVDKYIDLFSNL